MRRTDYWPDDRVTVLKTLWREGKSASQAARALGITRNSVIGKLNRLGMIGVRNRDKRKWNAAAVRLPPSPPRSFSWEQHA